MAYQKSGGFRPRGDFNRPRGGDFNRRPRTWHKAVCSECGKDCEVPFKPNPDRPVYCKECFSERKGFDDSKKPERDVKEKVKGIKEDLEEVKEEVEEIKEGLEDVEDEIEDDFEEDSDEDE